MKIKAEYVFNTDLKTLLDVCVYQVIGNVDYFKESYEDIADVKLIERKDFDDGRIHVKLEFCAHGQIPKAVQHLIKPQMLTWREISTWDEKAKRYNFEVRPHYFQNVFKCTGYWGYREAGPGKSLQFCEGDLTIKIPIFGPIIEKAIWSALEKNWKDSYQKMKKKHNI